MYVYFIYSKQQFNDRTKVENNIGKKFSPGTVLVKGSRKQYTELNNTGESSYSDATIVAEGELSRMNYTKIQSI